MIVINNKLESLSVTAVKKLMNGSRDTYIDQESGVGSTRSHGERPGKEWNCGPPSFRVFRPLSFSPILPKFFV